jgi:4-amino-4-deoxy-L-arabinose transferase-like glycosyltransferase
MNLPQKNSQNKISQNSFQQLINKLSPLFFLLLIGVISLYLTRPDNFNIKWFDETLYYTVAQNISRNFDFNNHHYLSSSIIAKGYPTKDTHLPGYPLIIALGFQLFGISEKIPFFINYLILAISLIAIYSIGKKIVNPTVGILGGIIYLCFPYTLILTHAIMTEIVAGCFVIITALILLKPLENQDNQPTFLPYIKGCILAGLIAFAYLIKPFLLILLPVSLIIIYINKDLNYQKILFSLLTTFTILGITILLPLSSNQEIYPYALTKITGYMAKGDLINALILTKDNFIFNLGLLFNIAKFPIYSAISLTIFSCLILGLIHLFYFKYYENNQLTTIQINTYKTLIIFTAGTFIPVCLAVLFLYQYIDMGMRGLTSFSPLLSIILAVHIWQVYHVYKHQRSLKIKLQILMTIIIIFILFLSTIGNFQQLINLQLRQSQRLYTNSDRLLKVMKEFNLQPRMVMSAKNFYLPVAAYPTQVIWQLPENLQELQAVEKKVTIDLIELRDDHPLFQENLQKHGSFQILDNRYRLGDQIGNYYFYFP